MKAYLCSRWLGQGIGNFNVNNDKSLLHYFVSAGKLLATTIVSTVILGLLPVAVAAAVFVGPAIGVVRLHKYLAHKRKAKAMRAIDVGSAEFSRCCALPVGWDMESYVRCEDNDEHVYPLVLDLRIEDPRFILMSGSQPSNGVERLQPRPLSARGVRYAHALGHHPQMLIAFKDEMTHL